MDQTPNLQLPYIMPSQAQKHVTHNEAIRALDALVQMSVLERDLATPPASPADGSRYLVAFGGLEAWAGKDGVIAAWQDGAWAFFTPAVGWLVWVSDEDRLLCHDGAAFIDAAVHSVNPAPLVGVNAIADATNRLSVKSPTSLFDNEGGDHRMKINKAAAVDTASVLFQSGYSGRAEFGLAGNDDWTVKVSADGAAWVEALKVDAATGLVRLPAGLALGDDDQAVASRHVREKLAANRTYYVRTDGSDANTGLVDSAGGAFLTIQKAMAVVAKLDFAGFTITIQVRDGIYTGATTIPVTVGQSAAGNLIIRGNAATPANVVITTTSLNCFHFPAGARARILDLEMGTITNGNCINITGGAAEYGNVRFGACVGAHVFIGSGQAKMVGDATISGGASQHVWARDGGLWNGEFRTITLTGTPAFSYAFAYGTMNGTIEASIITFSGAATGRRYEAVSGGAIQSGGGGAGYFPGDIAGSATLPGIYM